MSEQAGTYTQEPSPSTRPLTSAVTHLAQTLLLVERGRRQSLNGRKAKLLEQIGDQLRAMRSALEHLSRAEEGC